jgi:O-antigen/teichoic acid export membrane protein
VESYGLTNYYIALASVFSAVALLGLDATVITYMAKGETRIWYQANSLILISGFSVTIVLALFQWTSGILALAMVFFMMALAEALGRKKYREYAALSVGQRVAQIALSLLLYYFFGILGIVFGYFLGNLIFSYKYFRSIPNFTLKLDSVKEKRAFAMHSYGFNLIRNFTMNLDKVVIAPIFGYYMLGLYQLGFQFFMFLSIIPLSLYYYLLPEESSGKNKKNIKILGVGLASLAAICSIIAVPFIVTKLFPSFFESIVVVQIMCIAVIPSTVSAVLNASLLGHGRSSVVLIGGIIYMAVLIAALLLLGQIFGVWGLAVTLVLAQSMQAGYLLIQGRLKK